MSELLGNIYDGSIAIVFGTVFLDLFEDCGNLFFDEKFSKIFFFLIQKTAELVLGKLP